MVLGLKLGIICFALAGLALATVIPLVNERISLSTSSAFIKCWMIELKKDLKSRIQ